jgi:hypothetical protein
MSHRRKKEYGRKPRSPGMTKIEEELYKNGNVKGRNMFKSAHNDKHTGECKARTVNILSSECPSMVIFKNM